MKTRYTIINLMGFLTTLIGLYIGSSIVVILGVAAFITVRLDEIEDKIK